MFVAENASIHPLEIKMSANQGKKETHIFDAIEKTAPTRENGGIVCIVQRSFPLYRSDTYSVKPHLEFTFTVFYQGIKTASSSEMEQTGRSINPVVDVR